MDVQLDANELRELFGELKQKVVNLYATQAPKKEIDRVMEVVIKLELYMNADFRGLWLWERKLAKNQGGVSSPPTQPTTSPTTQPTNQPAEPKDDRGLTYFF
jgi:hypothetical protein